MSFIFQGIADGWDLIVSRDPFLMNLVYNTLKVAGIPTLVALLLGLPMGLALGLGRFRGSGVGRVVANMGLGLPPVVVGVVVFLLIIPAGPFGRFQLAYSLRGVYVAQTLLALPIVVALTSSAVRDLPLGLVDQARAFGAGRLRVAALALRECRVGVLAATIAALGSGLSEVGAVVIVGGNIQGTSQTLASAALQAIDAAQYPQAIAIAMVLMGLILLITAVLTWLQYASLRTRRLGSS